MPEAVAWDIVSRAAAGDADARRRLVEETVDDLWTLAMRLTRRQNEAEDVVQETYARTFASLGGLTPNGRFEGYLARIATNLVLERWRRQKPETAASDAVLPPDDDEPWQTAADREERSHRLATVWQAIQDLDPPMRAAMLLFYAQGESCEAIGRILDAPVGTVKTWLHRSRNHVRQAAESAMRAGAATTRLPQGDDA
jgi:RNA polymerase sigma-70 factor (ECF subfamily)